MAHARQKINRYEHVLSLYKDPPEGEMFLWDLETLTAERLQVLQILEQATKQGHKLYSSQWRNAVLTLLHEHKIQRYVKLIESTGSDSTDAEEKIRHEELVAHYTLRLAFCDTQELQDWFVEREVELCKMRYDSLSADGAASFIKTTTFNGPPIPEDEKNTLMRGLVESTVGYSADEIQHGDFFKLPFTKALTLVKYRSVFVHKGFAYVPRQRLDSCVVLSFREQLLDSLRLAKVRLPSLMDDRLTDLFNELNVSSCLARTDSSETFTADSLPDVIRSFPLCMRSLYDVVKNKHHLRYHGRLQLNWFFKGIGLPVEEAVNYWRSEFCKLIDEHTFNKKYQYYIRHAYGTVGGKINYVPLDCTQIIAADPGLGEYHSCPFKLWDAETIRQVMLECEISQDGTSEVIACAEEGSYQKACAMCFKHLHKGRESRDAIVSHPNEYFTDSRRILTDILGDSDSECEYE